MCWELVRRPVRGESKRVAGSVGSEALALGPDHIRFKVRSWDLL